MSGAPDDLTPVQLRCLEVLAATGGTSRVGDLAVALGVVASSASRLVDRLVALGLVSRRAGRSRREVDVMITAAGRRALRRCAAAVSHALEQVAAQMDPDDRRSLRRGLAALSEVAARAQQPQGSLDVPTEDR
ncbi:MarR family transcriptional regulator [Pseudokineococcus basanitobsidens]|uniref:MarR family transcriptional regulator n=1 Tax=Pseudokineococcus basanitobsidens TaxID=1926649 RepID=A0ABU8RPF8_9ACTN